MAALVCDICGGKLIMGAGGIAVCDSCGMEHSADRMKEKVQEIKGTVRVDNSHMVKNYLEMAQSAKVAGNNAEAESYCNKIIEIEPTNYKAWMLKGEAAAWQSSLKNSRVDEGVAAFIKAINNAPDDVKNDLVEEAKDQIKKLSVAMISLRGDRFVKWPDEEESDGFISDITSILGTVVTFLSQTGVSIPLSEIMAPIAKLINQSVVQAWQNVIWPDYIGDSDDSDDRAGKYEWQNFIKRVGYCTSLVEKAISLCDEDDEEDIQRYENLIFIHQAAIDSCSWDYDINSWGKSWHKEWMLTDEAKDIRRDKIRDYEEKIKAIKEAKEAKEKEAAKKRFDDYWAEHADEKAQYEERIRAIDTEIKGLHETVAQYDARISGIREEENVLLPLEGQLAEMRRQQVDLVNRKGKLGLFSGKQKKELQGQIDMLKSQIFTFEESVKQQKRSMQNDIAARVAPIEAERKPYLDKISALENEKRNIDVELTKER